MFRAYSTSLDSTGSGSIVFSPNQVAKEWDIYQISVVTTPQQAGTSCRILHNKFFRCSTGQGSEDTATGPPDIVCQPSETVTVQWDNGPANGTASCHVWYNENSTGTTVSLAH